MFEESKYNNKMSKTYEVFQSELSSLIVSPLTYNLFNFGRYIVPSPSTFAWLESSRSLDITIFMESPGPIMYSLEGNWSRNSRGIFLFISISEE